MIRKDSSSKNRTKEQNHQEEASLAEAINCKLRRKKKKKNAKQVHLDALLAKRLAEEETLSEQQKKRKAQVQFEAQFYTEKTGSYKATTKAQLKRYGEELQTEISNKQRIDDKDVSDTEEKVGKVIEEEPEKRIFQQGERSIYQIIRANRADTVYMSFGAMLNVHCLTLEAAHIYMLTEVKYPLPSRVCQAMLEKKLIGDRKDEEAHNEDTQRNLKFTSEDQVRGGLLGIIVNRLKSGSYRVKSGRHS
ncbi:hypothetical protein Tco_0676377 [Tanacetum coccineum]